MKTFKDLFEPARDEKWKINQVKYEYNFQLACELLIPIRKRFDLELKHKFGKDYIYDVSDDHVLGATLIGETVEKAIEMSNWNPKLLIKEGWLHDNLHLWGMVRVTKEEHHKDNIVRNKHNLNEKLNFEHYKTINIDDLVLY